ncbi:hypothetical protein [Acinetobacter sp.]|jgi:hypothetical protein|uniref:hypothetical protein n=1 Tax=Acinetobacter sp. TaxID=472 RepID=UPI00281F67B5|nr:hypothetical protein [Acinetobacter sp.]MDR0237573.1 hypothetical protein [Acinetobacter sp.]
MSPLGEGTGRTPRSTEDFCHFSSLKSEAWPTQWYLKISKQNVAMKAFLSSNSLLPNIIDLIKKIN